jgi:hypothetical protein
LPSGQPSYTSSNQGRRARSPCGRDRCTRHAACEGGCLSGRAGSNQPRAPRELTWGFAASCARGEASSERRCSRPPSQAAILVQSIFRPSATTSTTFNCASASLLPRSLHSDSKFVPAPSGRERSSSTAAQSAGGPRLGPLRGAAADHRGVTLPCTKKEARPLHTRHIEPRGQQQLDRHGISD